MRIAILGVALTSLSACASWTPQDVAGDPNAININDALQSVAVGLVNFGNTLKANDTVIGMVTCKVTVNFNISAQADRGGTVGGAFSGGASGASAKLSVMQTNTSEGKRGNTIEIVLGSVFPGTCGVVDGGSTGQGGSGQIQGGTTESASPRGGQRGGGGGGGGTPTIPLPLAPLPAAGTFRPYGLHLTPEENDKLKKLLAPTALAPTPGTATPR